MPSSNSNQSSNLGTNPSSPINTPQTTTSSKPQQKPIDIDVRSIDSSMSSATLTNNPSTTSNKSWRQKLFRSDRLGGDRKEKSTPAAVTGKKSSGEGEEDAKKKTAAMGRVERKYPHMSLYSPTGSPTQARLL